MSNETSARIEGESRPQICHHPVGTEACVLLANHEGPHAPVCNLPPAGWRCSRGRGHEGPCAASPVCIHGVGWPGDCAECLADEPKVGESGLSDDQVAKEKVLAATEERGWLPEVLHRASLESLVIRWVQDKASDQELRDLRDVISSPHFEAKPEPLPNTRYVSVDPAIGTDRTVYHDGEGNEVPAPNTLQEERARTIVKRIVTNAISAVFGRFDIKRDYVNEDGDGLNEDELIADALALALGDDIGCLDENDDDFRERIDLLWLEDLLAAPKVVDSKEEQEP